MSFLIGVTLAALGYWLLVEPPDPFLLIEGALIGFVLFWSWRRLSAGIRSRTGPGR